MDVPLGTQTRLLLHVLKMCPKVRNVVGGGASAVVGTGESVKQLQLDVHTKCSVGEELGVLVLGEAGNVTFDGA